MTTGVMTSATARPRVIRIRSVTMPLEIPGNSMIVEPTRANTSRKEKIFNDRNSESMASRLARRYPPAARARREEGVATVAFTMTRGGKVTSTSIVSSTGSSLLDREALETVRRAQPLPAVPDDIEAPLRLVVRLEFFVK